MSSLLRKVSLWAYLFLFFLPTLTAQHIPAWEHREYYHLFTLEKRHLEDYSSPTLQYLNAYKEALNNIIFEVPSEETAISIIQNTYDVIEDAEMPLKYKLYYQADLLMLSSYLQLKQGNELKFMWIMNDVYRISERLTTEFPDFKPAKKISGVLKIMVGAVPDQYHWILNLLGYEGDTEDGIHPYKGRP